MKRDDVIRIGSWIAHKGKVTKEELRERLRAEELSSSSDLSPLIKQLIDEGQCFEHRDGVYLPMAERVRFKPSEIDLTLESVLSELPFPIAVCPVSGYELNRFLSLQSFSPRLIVYAPKVVHGELASLLARHGYQPVALRKGNAPYTNDKTVFLSGLHWRTPLDRRGKRLYASADSPLICAPTIEKLLIDCLSGDFGGDDAMFEEIFRNALRQYAYNASTLERYAKDRSKEERLKIIIAKSGLEEEFYD
jgi:hypothetical protein